VLWLKGKQSVETGQTQWVDGADALDGNGVKDASGTPMEETYIFRFSTGDTIEPCA
jgi:hypothetical protein